MLLILGVFICLTQEAGEQRGQRQPKSRLHFLSIERSRAPGKVHRCSQAKLTAIKNAPLFRDGQETGRKTKNSNRERESTQEEEPMGVESETDKEKIKPKTKR